MTLNPWFWRFDSAKNEPRNLNSAPPPPFRNRSSDWNG
jgi:hypothetical protein